MGGRVMLKPVQVVTHSNAPKFVTLCDELCGQGYRLVAAGCGNDHDGNIYYQAIFALPGAVISPPCAAKKVDWCPVETHCVYRDVDGTCTHPKGSHPCAIPPL